MNSERRAIALALVQQTALQQAQRTIAELHECTVLADIKEIEYNQLCIRLYNHEKSKSIIIARDNIHIDVVTDQTALFSYLESTVALFGVNARGESLHVHDKSNWDNFYMIIYGDGEYTLCYNGECYDDRNMLVSVIDKICKALYAFANHMPIN
jgi:hypothetical protein